MTRDYHSMLRIVNLNHNVYVDYIKNFHPPALDSKFKFYLNGLVVRLQL